MLGLVTTTADGRGTDQPLPWRRGIYIAVDQAAFSFANFGVALVLARMLPSGDHGRFAVSFAGLTLALQFHAAWVTIPLLMLTQRQPPHLVRQYLGAVVRMHFSTMTMLFLLVSTLAALSWSFDPRLALCLAAASIGIPLSVTHVGVRMMCMALAAPRGAAVSSLAALVTMAVGLLLAMRHLTPVTAWLLIALASLAGIVGSLPWTRHIDKPTMEMKREVTGQHTALGRWGLGTAALRWVPQGTPFLLLPLLRPSDGLVLAGNLKACMTLLTPPLRISAAFAQSAIPEMTRRLSEGKPALSRGTVSAPLLLSVVWGGLCLLFGKEILALVYDDRAVPWAGTLHALAGLPLMYTLVTFTNSLQLANHRPQHEFLMHLSAAVGFVAVMLVFVPRYGSVGAAYAIFGAYVMSVYFYLMMLARNHQSSGGST